MNKAKIVTALRWIAVLPAAIGAAVVASLGLTLIMNMGEPFEPWHQQLVLVIVTSAAFVYAGASVAPSHSKETAICLVAIIAMLRGGGLALHYAHWELICTLVGVGSAIAAALTTKKKKVLGPLGDHPPITGWN